MNTDIEYVLNRFDRVVICGGPKAAGSSSSARPSTAKLRPSQLEWMRRYADGGPVQVCRDASEVPDILGIRPPTFTREIEIPESRR